MLARPLSCCVSPTLWMLVSLYSHPGINWLVQRSLLSTVQGTSDPLNEKACIIKWEVFKKVDQLVSRTSSFCDACSLDPVFLEDIPPMWHNTIVLKLEDSALYYDALLHALRIFLSNFLRVTCKETLQFVV